MKSQYIPPLILTLLSLAVLAYASKRQKTDKALANTKYTNTTAIIGTTGTILLVAGISWFLSRIK